MAQRNFSIGKKHNDLLERLKEQLDIPYTQVIGRALEALEEKLAQRAKNVDGA